MYNPLKMNTFIVFDTETGGTTLDTSLLTAYFAIFDEKFVKVDELYLKVKPDSGQYVVTGEALSINGINLAEHEKVSIPYKEAKPLLYKFLEQNYQGQKLIPVGHGIYFDILRIKQNLISAGSWENFVSHRTLDTGVVAQFMRVLGVMPMDVSGSLGSLCSFFKVPDSGTLHDAKVDALQTFQVLKKMLLVCGTIHLSGFSL